MQRVAARTNEKASEGDDECCSGAHRVGWARETRALQRQSRQDFLPTMLSRNFSTLIFARNILHRSLHSGNQQINAWFVQQPPPLAESQQDSPLAPPLLQPIPEHAPGYLKTLHGVLATSPLLEPSELLVSRPIRHSDGPGLPSARNKGKRRIRSRMNSGQGIDGDLSVWDWALYAQVWLQR
jgi:hypothetical protein